jgi:hypothetical protein
VQVQKGESTLAAVHSQDKQGWIATRMVHVLNLYLINHYGMVSTTPLYVVYLCCLSCTWDLNTTRIWLGPFADYAFTHGWQI